MSLPPVTVAVEGPTDGAVAARLLAHVGLAAGPVHICGGKHKLDLRLTGFSHAARHAPWFVLRDLDRDAACAPELLATRQFQAREQLCFRIAMRAVEAWLLSDANGMAQFLHVGVGRVSSAPDTLLDPKAELVRLAGLSRRRDLRLDLTPAAGTSARVGPAYTARIIELASGIWDPERAMANSPSLVRCLQALGKLRDLLASRPVR